MKARSSSHIFALAGGLRPALATVVCVALVAGPARAELKFSAPEADAGVVHVGAPLSHVFAFQNTGPQTIEITNLSVSCGCLTPRLDKLGYAPGESGSIRLEVNTLTQPAGLQSLSVAVTYREGAARKTCTLRLCARMVREIEVQPAALVLRATGAIHHTIAVRDDRPHPLTVTAVRSSAPALRVSLEQPMSAGHFTVDVFLDTDYPEGRHQEVVSIYTNDPGSYREFRVPVLVDRQARRRITARPPEVELRIAPDQSASSQIVLLRDRDNQPIVVDSVRADDPAVTAKWAAGPGTMATLRVIVDRRQASDSTFTTVVHVHLAKPVAEELLIPVSCDVQGR